MLDAATRSSNPVENDPPAGRTEDYSSVEITHSSLNATDVGAFGPEQIGAMSVLPSSQTLEISTASLVERGLLPHATIGQPADVVELPPPPFPPEEPESGTEKVCDSIGDSVVAFLASPEDAEIFSDFEDLASRCGVASLTNGQKLNIIYMQSDMKSMFRSTLSELEKLKNGAISPSDYMASSLLTAARLAEENGMPCLKPNESSDVALCMHSQGVWSPFGNTSNELFRDYVGMAFSTAPLGFKKDTLRNIVGDGPHPSGHSLESVYNAIVAGRAGEGFNTNITDIDPKSTITHHFAEFLGVGFDSGRLVGNLAATIIDDPDVNPGDVRSGYFGSMIGEALFLGRITPTEAANLTIWAFTTHGGSQPPWGAAAEEGSFLVPADYQIDGWLTAFNRSGID